jgi:hypothetical protein
MKVTVWSHLHREDTWGKLGAGGTRPGVRDYEAPLISLENSESGLMLRTFNEELHDTTCAVYGPHGLVPSWRCWSRPRMRCRG